MMWIRKILPFIPAFVLVLFFTACGGGGESSGTPGTKGEWNPQIAFVTGRYCNNEDQAPDKATNPDVDAFFDTDIDCKPTTPEIEVEFFGNHRLAIGIYNVDLPGRVGSAVPVTITKMTIEYRRAPNDLPGAPILQSRTLYPTLTIQPITEEQLRATPPPSPAVLFTDLVDLETKDEFRTQYESGERVPPDFPTRYTAVIKLFGTNIYDETLEANLNFDFTIGDYDYCKCTE
jgi:hypothetical protein